MHLSDLQGKDIVNVNDGTKIGSIIDVIIDNNSDKDNLKRQILTQIDRILKAYELKSTR